MTNLEYYFINGDTRALSDETLEKQEKYDKNLTDMNAYKK